MPCFQGLSGLFHKNFSYCYDYEKYILYSCIDKHFSLMKEELK